MSSATFKALIIDTLSTMDNSQLMNIISTISDTNLEVVGKAVLAEKGRKGKEKVAGGKAVEGHVVKKVEREGEAVETSTCRVRSSKMITPIASQTKSVQEAGVSVRKRKCEPVKYIPSIPYAYMQSSASSPMPRRVESATIIKPLASCSQTTPQTKPTRRPPPNVSS